MSFASALASIDAINQARAEVATFGHLFPEHGRQYAGTLLFVHAPYGGALEPLAAEFPDLPDSPCFYDDMTEQIGSWLDDIRRAGRDTDDGSLYLFTGTYCRTYPSARPSDQTDEEYDAWEPEPGGASFTGTVQRVALTSDVLAAGVRRARQQDRRAAASTPRSHVEPGGLW